MTLKNLYWGLKWQLSVLHHRRHLPLCRLGFSKRNSAWSEMIGQTDIHFAMLIGLLFLWFTWSIVLLVPLSSMTSSKIGPLTSDLWHGFTWWINTPIKSHVSQAILQFKCCSARITQLNEIVDTVDMRSSQYMFTGNLTAVSSFFSYTTTSGHQHRHAADSRDKSTPPS